MPEPGDLKRHIVFSGRTEPYIYTSPKIGNSGLVVKDRNRSQHGNALKAKLEEIQQEANAETEPPAGILHEDAIYIEFVSDFNVELAFDGFEDGRSGNYHFLKCSKEGEQFKIAVFLNSRGVSAFIRKIEAYLTQQTPNGNPKNQALLNNILEIRRATVQSFWNDDPMLFPEPQQEIWWEVWIRRTNFNSDTSEDQKVANQLLAVNAELADRRLLFPEHIVRLVKATPEKLSQSLLLLDNLAELRMAKDTAEFFTDLTRSDQQDWTRDLISRTDNNVAADSVAICILDTGVNNEHPLLIPFLPNANMDSVNPAWGNHDGHPTGHGTQMAGLALYGDLQAALTTRSRVQVYHQLESVKIINYHAPHHPDVYGQVTIECVNRAIILNARRKRIFCMAVTSDDNRDQGRPSSWSTAIDQTIFGASGTSNDKLLFLVSGGNVIHDHPNEYPDRNITDSIHDPGQAFNALTVGGYTELDSIDQTRFPASLPLAKKGAMAPCNTTSCTWEKWPIKPEVVFEAGNNGVQNNGLIMPDSLQVLTTAKDFLNNHFTTFDATSCATALASHFAATISHQYPELWPETVRGMMIHSAEWTQEMTGRRRVATLRVQEKLNLLRTVGFGVPNIFRALNSLSNSLTLIAQRNIQPFRKIEGQPVKTFQVHMIDLPWPVEELTALGETEVKMTVTLSYFIEPNPGSRFYSSKFTYQSHGLRFKIKRPLETVNNFKLRINKAAREDTDYERSTDSDRWVLGERARDQGSVQKDIWIGNAVDLASMNTIAIHPINGWWRFRTKLNRYNQEVRYSLIITLETASADVDIYTPVYNAITVQV